MKTFTIDSENNITAFGTADVLFSAYDAQGDQELWVSNGTSADTKQLTTTDAGPTYITSFVNATGTQEAVPFAHIPSRLR